MIFHTGHIIYFNSFFLEPEQYAETCHRALRFDNLTAEEFDNTWKACAKFRLSFIKKGIKIMNRKKESDQDKYQFP